MNHSSPPLRGNYKSSPIRKPAGFAFDSSAAVAQAVINSRSGAFSKQRSQSFIDRGTGGPGSGAMSPRRSRFRRYDWLATG
ncbi:hypothetical protein LXL04_035840 [Taraxacum kok-saghyz]